jgi:predicted acetylornithine/succinylornithine family transaminase
VVSALAEQSRLIWHVSNLHYSEPQARLAELLVRHSCADRVFLCNSGAEANEAAIKLARKYGHEHGGRFEIITTLNSFHGRTLGTITATGQDKVRLGFEPLFAGFRYVPYDDCAAVEQSITQDTIALLIEPVQGEGGVIVPRPGYLRELRQLCDGHELLLILDEVQTGMGRTGKLFGYQHDEATPDIFTLAKGLGTGIPIGAMLATERVAASFGKGAHGTTFGGNALASAVAVAVVETLLGSGVIDNCATMGKRLQQGLHQLAAKHSFVREVRGRGLLVAAELSGPAAPIVDRARESGLILNAAGEKVLRFAPPLTVGAQEVDEALSIMERVFES